MKCFLVLSQNEENGLIYMYIYILMYIMDLYMFTYIYNGLDTIVK